VLGATPWAGQWRRRQHLFSALARLRSVYHIDPPVPPRHLARRRPALTPHAAVAGGGAAARQEVRCIGGPPGLPAQRFSARMRCWNAVLQRRWVAGCLRALAHRGVRRPILFSYDALLHPLPGEIEIAQHLFDCIDDYPARTPLRSLRARLESRTQALAAACDFTLVPNEPLAARLRAAARRIELLPHAVDPACFHPRADRETSFAALRALPGIKAVYHGTLDAKLDEAILTGLLRAGIRILVAGERAWPRETLARLRRAGDLRDFGLLDRHGAAALVAAADVGILPYRAFPGCEGAQVLKRLEFFAAGLPVVASDIAPCRREREETILAAGPEAFVAGVRRAASAADDETACERRLAIARANTWEQRALRLDAWLAP
jgi:teichuronic acid biosynthesis glycosyltransferase TuaH